MKERPVEHSPKRFAMESVTCPSCHETVERDANWCGSCGFTGAKSLEMFGDNPPPLLPILDAVDLWDKKATRTIRAEMKSFKRRFPQITWRICAVSLDPSISLSLFGFWLLNVCPLNAGESDEDREWTLLLLVDSNTGRVSVTTGFRAEVWLSNHMWNRALSGLTEDFAGKRSAKAVVEFLRAARRLYEVAWKRSKKKLEAK